MQLITQLEVFTPRVTNSPLPVTDGTEETDPIQIKKIDGLGPVNATVNTDQYGSVDGEFYNGSNTGKRNIVLTLLLNPDWSSQTIEQLRQVLYRYFMPKNEVTLRFTSTHMAQVEITGYVESCEPNLWDKDAEYQVSIICPDAAFVATQPSNIQGTTLAFGSNSFTSIDYEGTLPAGFVLRVAANTANPSATGEVRLVNTNPDITILIVTGTTVDSTHSLEFGTSQGDKYIDEIPLPSGSSSSLLGKLADGSNWPTLDEGINEFQVLAADPGQDWSMTYIARYGGL